MSRKLAIVPLSGMRRLMYMYTQRTRRRTRKEFEVDILGNLTCCVRQ